MKTKLCTFILLSWIGGFIVPTNNALHAQAQAQMSEPKTKITFSKPQINLYVKNVQLMVNFYSNLGFSEIFRTPEKGDPIHVELALDSFILGIASIEAAREMHMIPIPDGNGFPRTELVVWTEDVDKAFDSLIKSGAKEISKPHDFLTDLRAAWIYDPEGNPVQIYTKR